MKPPIEVIEADWYARQDGEWILNIRTHEPSRPGFFWVRGYIFHYTHTGEVWRYFKR